jgi:poly-beta-1,6-N-acetyl-D-glucosamine N-deacetylase
MKYVKLFGLLIIILSTVYFLKDNLKVSKPAAMGFPEKLDTNGCLGLTYHRVYESNLMNKTIELLTGSEELTKYNVYDDEFKQEMEFLKENGANFVSPEEIRRDQEIGEFPEKCIWISFDDIDDSVYQNAFPILKENNIPFTLFVIAGHVGKDFGNLKLATWRNLQEMIDSGLTTIGSHTYDMHQLKGTKPIFFQKGQQKNFEEDLFLSKKIIEKNLSIQVKDFAYPYGNGRKDLVDIIKKTGFESAFILAPRSITEKNDRYWMNRILVNDVVFDDIVSKWVK